MQEKRQNISPVKERILYFIDFLRVSKREFYSKTGISRGTLESHTGITEETMAKFIATYPEISLDWLILGHGEMVRLPAQEAVETPTADLTGMARELVDAKDEIIELQKDQIGALKEMIRLMKESGRG